MDFSSILKLLPFIMQGISLAQQINNQKTSGTKVVEIVQGNLPDVFDLFAGVGKTLFPELPQPSQVAAAAVVLDTDTARHVQGQLNKLGVNPALDVDGVYGQKTKTAVAAFQRANPPLVVDGWAGAETQKVLNSKSA